MEQLSFDMRGASLFICFTDDVGIVERTFQVVARQYTRLKWRAFDGLHKSCKTLIRLVVLYRYGR